MPPAVHALQETSFSLLCGGFDRCSPAWDKPADGLDQCYKLYFVVAGGAELTLDTQPTAQLSAGHAYLIPGYQLRRQSCPRSMAVHWVHFVPDSLYLAFLMHHVSGLHQWNLSALASWRATYEHLGHLVERPPQWLHYRTQALLLYVVSLTLESYNFSHMAAVDPVFEQLQPAITYMEDHLLENPTLEKIAQVVHLAPNYFHRKFTNTFHVTPFAYLLQSRLNLARQLLLSTKLTLEQVAARCGFHCPFYFSRMFKKCFYVGPTQFREGARP